MILGLGSGSFGIERCTQTFLTMIGVMLVIVLIGLLTDKILFAPIERFLHRRWGTGLR
jgi:hypothetical protein